MTEPRPIPAHWSHETCNRCGLPRTARDLETMAEIARAHRAACLGWVAVPSSESGAYPWVWTSAGGGGGWITSRRS